MVLQVSRYTCTLQYVVRWFLLFQDVLSTTTLLKNPNGGQLCGATGTIKDWNAQHGVGLCRIAHGKSQNIGRVIGFAVNVSNIPSLAREGGSGNNATAQWIHETIIAAL